MPDPADSAPDPSLVRLLSLLQERSYRFVTPTDLTHRRVLRRPDKQLASSLRDVFGWSLPFDAAVLGDDLLGLLEAAGEVERRGALWFSRVRVSSLGERLFLHSAFPTDQADSVFFGPDSQRFADLIARELVALSDPVRRIVDIGGGTGVGGLTALALTPEARAAMTDLNPRALRLARVNAAHAGLALETIEADGLEGIDGPFDLVLANPPYLADETRLAYRHGGDLYGGRVPVDWTAAAVERLAPGGRFILYTGAAIIDGAAPLLDAATAVCAQAGCAVRVRELDPDIFGEELDKPPYAEVERIAAVALIATARGERAPPRCARRSAIGQAAPVPWRRAPLAEW